MAEEYTPTGSTLSFTVPVFAETADGPGMLRALADDVASNIEGLKYLSVLTQTANYTLEAATASGIVQVNASSGITITVPPNSSVPMPVGSTVSILQVGTGQATVVGGAGVTVNGTPGLKTRAQWSMLVLIKRSTDSWVVVGDSVA